MILFTEHSSHLNVTLLFAKKFSLGVVKVYIPSAMIVVLSWTSFWLDVECVAARVSLAITAMLTFVTQVFNKNQILYGLYNTVVDPENVDGWGKGEANFKKLSTEGGNLKKIAHTYVTSKKR